MTKVDEDSFSCKGKALPGKKG